VKVPRLGVIGFARRVHRHELRAHRTAAIGEAVRLRWRPEQRAAKLVRELPDRSRGRGLRDVAALARTGEAQGLAEREEGLAPGGTPFADRS
jgi:hypothetical protein